MNTLEVMDILLVEDNPEDAELTIRALRSQNLANRIVHVEDGAAALDYIFCHGVYSIRDIGETPNVVLLDLKLPKVSGLEVLRALKRDERTCSVPVVVVTSSREDPDIREAYFLGANSYVVKPVEFDAFSEAMSRIGLYWLLVNQPPTRGGQSGVSHESGHQK
jgi:two-component system, response regulator